MGHSVEWKSPGIQGSVRALLCMQISFLRTLSEHPEVPKNEQTNKRTQLIVCIRGLCNMPPHLGKVRQVCGFCSSSSSFLEHLINNTNWRIYKKKKLGLKFRLSSFLKFTPTFETQPIHRLNQTMSHTARFHHGASSPLHPTNFPACSTLVNFSITSTMTPERSCTSEPPEPN